MKRKASAAVNLRHLLKKVLFRITCNEWKKTGRKWANCEVQLKKTEVVDVICEDSD